MSYSPVFNVTPALSITVDDLSVVLTPLVDGGVHSLSNLNARHCSPTIFATSYPHSDTPAPFLSMLFRNYPCNTLSMSFVGGDRRTALLPGHRVDNTH